MSNLMKLRYPVAFGFSPRLVRIFFIFGFLVFCQHFSSATVRYVKTDGNDSNTGLSWGQAYLTIQKAIEVSVSGDEIWVKAGTYLPTKEPDGTTDAPREFTFYLKNGVKIYGGFAGAETLRTQRNWTTNLTTLSGDVGTAGNAGDNCYHVVVSVNDANTTVLDGFTVKNGNANGTTNITIETISVFTATGGGMTNQTGSPTVANCIFSDNSCSYAGGGMCNVSASPILTNCLFSNNISTVTGSIGGGLTNFTSSPALTDCTFSGNSVASNGGGIYNDSSSPTLNSCLFSGNTSTAVNGGAIYNYNFSSPVSVNCIFSGNYAAGQGGAVRTISGTPVFMNCTFVGNTNAANQYGSVASSTSAPTFTNCVFYGNGRNGTGGQGSFGGANNVTYSIGDDINVATGNLPNVNPQLINVADPDGVDNIWGTTDDGVRLKVNSPAVGTGTNTGAPSDDFYGTARPSGTTVDMGAHEALPCVTAITDSLTIQRNVTCIAGANGEFQFQGKGGTLPYTYTLNTISGNVTNMTGYFDNLEPKEYRITIADAAGCSTTKIRKIDSPTDFTQFNNPGTDLDWTVDSISTVGSGGFTYNYLPASGTLAVYKPNGDSLAKYNAGNLNAISRYIQIGFPFKMDNFYYDSLVVSEDGVISFNRSINPLDVSSQWYNNISYTGSGTYSFPILGDCQCDTAYLNNPLPFIAPFRDDIQSNSSGSVASRIVYNLSGTAPNRVFTIEWRNMRWNRVCNVQRDNSVSFQVELYEGSNKVRFHYKPEVNLKLNNCGDIPNVVGYDYSIGLFGRRLGPGNYLSINPDSTVLYSNGKVKTRNQTFPSALGYEKGKHFELVPPDPSPLVCVAPISIVSATATCSSGSNGMITITSTGGLFPTNNSDRRYYYSKNGGKTYRRGIMPASGTIYQDTFRNLAPGTYRIAIRDSIQQSFVIQTVVVPNATITSQIIQPITCNGGTDGQIRYRWRSSLPTGTYDLRFQKVGSPFQDFTGLTDTTQLFIGLSAGTYNVTVTYNDYGCTSTATEDLTDPALLTYTPTTITQPVCPSNATTGTKTGSVVLRAAGGVPSGSTYTYTAPSGITPSGSTLLTRTYTNLAAGSYIFTVTDSRGCAQSSTVVISTPPDYAINNIVATNPLCNGANTGALSLNVTGGSAATFTSIIFGGTTSSNVTKGATLSRTGLSAGFYNVSVTEGTCTYIVNAAATLTSPTNVTFTSAPVTAVSCNGGTDGQLVLFVAGGTTPYMYSIDNGANYQSSSTFTGLTAGPYTLKAKDANNCPAVTSPTVTVTQPSALTFLTSKTDVTCAGMLGTITVTTLGGTGSRQYSKDNGANYQPSNIFTNLPAAMYQIVVKDDNNCTTAASSVTINSAGICCPTFTAAPANVTITNSTCNASCVATGGSFTAPGGTPCPTGSTLQYQVNGGAWTSVLPTYATTGPAQSIKTRCNCTADISMSSAESTPVVTIPANCTDVVPPTIMCPVNQTVTDPYTLTNFTGAATATDNCGTPVKTQSPITGTSLPIGTHTITLTATDGALLTATCAFTVTVQANCPISGTVWYVDAAQTYGNTGTSWSCAFQNVQDAINAASSGHEIWVKAGTYFPTKDPSGNASPADPRNKTFYLKNGVKIYGGFAGTETLRSQRNATANVTTLSGDIGTVLVNTDNCYHVIVSVNDANTTVLDGFTITKANASGSGSITVEAATIAQNLGGGMMNLGSSPTVNNCIFSANTANSGGGMANTSTSPATMTNCLFSGNNATFSAGAMLNNNSSAILTNCTFSGNKSSAFSGGIFNTSNSNIVLTNCLIWNNQAGGVTGSGSASMDNDVSLPVITYCLIQNYNDAGAGNINGVPNAADANYPQFVTPLDPATASTAGDFHLTACSPVQNRGTNTSAPATDLFGNVRPFGATVDMGVHEVQTAPTAVVAICKTATVSLDGAGNGTLAATAINNSSTGCAPLALSASPNTFNCSNLGPNTVTLTVTGLNGSTGTCSATVTVSDQLAPNALCRDIVRNLGSGGTVSITPADVNNLSNDNCGTVNLVSATPNAFTCSNLGANTVTLTVNDGHGNTATCNATVTIADNTAPTALCRNASVNLNSAGNVVISSAQINNGSSDNCSIATLSVVPGSFTCLNVGLQTVVLTATDNVGLSSTCSATVTISDVTPPTALCQPVSVNLSAAGTASVTGVQVNNGSSDNCGIASLSVAPNSFTCSNLGPQAVVLTVTDNNGLSSTCSTTVTVADAAAPTAICQNITTNLDGNGNASITAAQVDGGSTDNCSIVSRTVTPNTFTVSNLGANTVTLTVTDSSMHSASCTAIVTVSNNNLPNAVCKTYTAVLGANGSVPISAANVDGGSTAVGGIASLVVLPNTLSCSNLGTNTVVLTVTGNNGLQATCNATVTVQDNTAPTVVCQNIPVSLSGSTAAITAGQVLNAGASSDNCGTVNPASVTPNTFNCSNLGPNTVTLIANDGHGNTASCSAIVTVNDATVPTAICQNVAVNLGTNGTASVSAAQVNNGSSDNCGTVNLVSVLPNAFSCSSIGPNSVLLSINDGHGNTATCSAIVTVQDQTAPSALCRDIVVQLNGSGNATITATQINNGSTDNCSLGTLSVTPNAFTLANLGVNTVTLTVSDVNSNAATCSAQVTVQNNQLPNAVCQNITRNLGSNGQVTITAAEVDGGSTALGGISSRNVSPNILNCSNLGSNTVSLTIVGNNGQQASCNATVTINDNLAPTAVCQNIAVNLNSAGTASITPAQVNNGSSDNCGAVNLVNVSPNSFTCSNLGANPVTLNMNDGHGNTAACSATVTVNDNTAPTPVCKNISVNLNSGGNASVTPAQVFDPMLSGDNCGVVNAVNVTPSTFNCMNLGANTVILTANDGHGNSATCSAIVTISDNTPPTVVCQNTSVSLNSAGTASITSAQVFNAGLSSDNCGTVNLVSATPNTFNCTNLGPNTVVLTVNDGHSNAATCSAVVTVNDNTAPTVVCQNTSVTLSGGGTASITAAQVYGSSSDNCGTVNLVSAVPNNFTCSNLGTNTITLTVNDGHGNTAICTAVVTVRDQTAPVVTCPANQEVAANASCQGVMGNYVALATKSDNCTAPSNIELSQSPAPGTLITTTTTVTLLATDASGNSANCNFTVSIRDVTPPNINCPAGKTVSADTNVPCTAIVNSIDAVFSDLCSSFSLAYTLSGGTTGSGSGQASGQLFQAGSTTVTYIATDAGGLSSSCTFSIVVNPCQINITGAIFWKQDNTTGVKDVTVTVTGDQNASVVTGVNGQYNFTLQPGANFTITPDKNINKLNGVNAQDVSRIQQHLNGNLITNPWQLIAADVNSNNVISALDANIIQLALLGNPSALVQFVKSWRFVPTTYTLPSPPWGFPENIVLSGASGNQNNKDFYGVKVGDVVAVYANPAGLAPEPPLVLTAPDKVLQQGDELVIDFRANQISDLTACQFGLHFDPQRLQLLDILPLTALPLSEDNFGLYKQADGDINFLWAGAEAIALPEAAPVFQLKFKVLESGGKLSDALQLNEAALLARAYKSNEAESAVVLHYFGVTGTNNPGTSQEHLVLYQNQPNPFADRTLIGFELPEACLAQLRIFDASGRVVVARNKQYTAGLHSEVFDLEGVSGILYYELSTPFGVLTKKMVVVDK